jgi:hypothetical protein
MRATPAISHVIRAVILSAFFVVGLLVCWGLWDAARLSRY